MTQSLVKCSHCLKQKTKHENLCASHLKALKSKWYKKLEDKGFDDIEQDESRLKKWDSSYFAIRHSKESFFAKEQYYRMASQYLHDNKFENKLERIIWEHYVEGTTIRDIVSRVKAKGIKTYRDAVYRIIKRISNKMLEEYRNSDE